ncbi:MAG: DNA-directed RNA polymerase subunit H [Methanobrevibacter sp.]|nr:DNA-directed RNA polymerase subunit H [Methanobrevibacter sp.]
MKFDILEHESVPEHKILTEEEVEEIFKNLDYDKYQLPRIKVDDPVVKAIGAEEGDVLQITRESETAGTFVTYRFVNGFRKNDK